MSPRPEQRSRCAPMTSIAPNTSSTTPRADRTRNRPIRSYACAPTSCSPVGEAQNRSRCSSRPWCGIDAKAYASNSPPPWPRPPRATPAWATERKPGNSRRSSPLCCVNSPSASTTCNSPQSYWGEDDVGEVVAVLVAQGGEVTGLQRIDPRPTRGERTVQSRRGQAVVGGTETAGRAVGDDV